MFDLDDPSTDYIGILWTCIVFAFLLSFAMGANDVSNALGTSFGSKALTIYQAMFIGSVFEFVGAKFCSKNVAKGLAEEVILDFDQLPDIEQKVAMLSVFILAASFIMMASFFGIPLSSTHTVVASLIGAGVMTVGFENISKPKLRDILISWVVSPVSAGLICTLFYFMLKRLLRKSTRTWLRILTMILLGGVVFSVMYILIVQILVEDLFTDPSANKFWWIGLIGIFSLGVILIRFSILFYVYQKNLGKAIGHAFFVWEYGPITQHLNSDFSSFRKSEVGSFLTGRNDQSLALNPKSQSVRKTSDVSQNMDEKSLKRIANSFKEVIEIDSDAVYNSLRVLLILNSCQLSLAHGSNDVSNSISPLLVIFGIYKVNLDIAYWIGAAGIVVGLILLGRKTMETVGEKVIPLNYLRAFCVQFGGAITIMMGSKLGLPLSTTHCIIGGIASIAFIDKNEFEAGLDKWVLIKILIWWGVTIVMGIFGTMFVYWILSLIMI